MWNNFFTVAFRSLHKSKTYSAINILGLAAGLACAILLFSYISYLKSFDSQHPDAHLIYKTFALWKSGVAHMPRHDLPDAVNQRLLEQLPGISESAALSAAATDCYLQWFNPG